MSLVYQWHLCANDSDERGRYVLSEVRYPV